MRTSHGGVDAAVEKGPRTRPLWPREPRLDLRLRRARPPCARPRRSIKCGPAPCNATAPRAARHSARVDGGRMTLPLIGITCNTLAATDTRPLGFRLNQAYARAVIEAGGAPVLIPIFGEGEALRATFDVLAGLLLPGGADVDPTRYGAAPHPMSGEADPLLDETELALARWALDEGKPVLGICRGLQCLNVAAGGTLLQDVPTEVPNVLPHNVDPRDAIAHSILVEAVSQLADILGMTTIEVNSRHHQAVRELGSGFVATAWAPD